MTPGLRENESVISKSETSELSDEPHAASLLYLCIEAVGCPTVCRHCWAQGIPYRTMPVEDVAWVMEQAHQFCDDRGLAFDAYPMHEVAAHPDAAQLFRLFNYHSASARRGTMFEPLPSTGVPLAIREDWREVLKAAADTGTLNLWVAFHGLGEEHDRQVNRPGAFTETCLAVERIRSAGLSVGCNVFVTSDNLPQLDELMATLRRLPIDADVCWRVASFLPTPRSRRNERVRPTLADLLPVAHRVLEATCRLNRGWWANLEAQTEAAYVRRALGSEWPDEPKRPDGEIALVCRPNLDVYAGLAGLYRTRHGNLRAHGVEAVLNRALAQGRRPDDTLWFDLDPLPLPSDLAERHGNHVGLCVHSSSTSVRYLWLDRAKRAGLADRTQSRVPSRPAQGRR